jgi:hypothetical protein
MKIQNYVPPPQPENKFVAIDSEWFGLNSNLMHRPTSGKFGCMTIATDPETVYVIKEPENVNTALHSIRKCIWVMHHAKTTLNLILLSFVDIQRSSRARNSGIHY